MRFLLFLGLALVFVVGSVQISYGQSVPTIGVFFDSLLVQKSKDCPGPVLDVLYVAALDFDVQIAGAEYQIVFPPSVTYVADVDTPPVTIGSSDSGISLGFAIPRNGYEPVLLHKVQILWNCGGCSPTQDDPIVVVPHPSTPDPVVVARYPDYALIPGVGMTSFACSTVPVEDPSWGAIKAIYAAR